MKDHKSISGLSGSGTRQGTFFSPVSRKEGEMQKPFFPKKEDANPMIEACLDIQAANANFNEEKISDGILTKSATQFGKYTEVKNLYTDVYRLRFEKSDITRGKPLIIHVFNGAVIKEKIETDSTITIKLKAPSSGHIWTMVFFWGCTYLSINHGIASE